MDQGHSHERLDPLIPESREVDLQKYLAVIDGFCADLASELNVPETVLMRREMVEFWKVVLDAS